MSGIIFDSTSGEIARIITCDISSNAMQVQPGEDIVATEQTTGIDDSSHYVDVSGAEFVAVEKALLDTTHVISGLSVSFSTLPSGTEVKVGFLSGFSDGSDFEVVFDVPGSYVIKLYGPLAYTNTSVEVNVDST